MAISPRKKISLGICMQTDSLPVANHAYRCSFAFSSLSTETKSASGYIHMASVSMGVNKFRRELGLKGKWESDH